jgi:selenide,water dikinase
MESLDDAGVYKLSEDLALVQTLDYFTPIVRDPCVFGQIAAANALSDVYAMGGKPITAMNIVCFPMDSMDLAILREILRGGMDKLREADVPLVGGHSFIDRSEVKYGLSVTGVVHPQKILENNAKVIGDKLILTKPIGTGIVNNALKKGILDDDTEAEAIQVMSTLNKRASEIALEAGIRSCTDITGFGLIGHLVEMIEGNNVGMEVYSSLIPMLPRTAEFAEMGLIPPGSRRNRKAREDKIEVAKGVPESRVWVLFDAQTSGGLVFSAPSQKAEGLLGSLHKAGVKDAAIIGQVTPEPVGKILVK